MPTIKGPLWLVQPGEDQPMPEPPIVLPPDVTPPDQGGGDIIPTHPIVLPGDPSWGTNDNEEPSHPIVLPPEVQPPEVVPPEKENVGSCDTYQRKTLGINWDESFDTSSVVGIYAGVGENEPGLVRTVVNDGTSSVTYPQDFTGDVTIRVMGQDGYLEAKATVQ